jgi:hypothetical protein
MSLKPFTVYVRGVDNKSTPITGVTEDMTLEDLKAKIKEKIGIAPSQHRLIKNGKLLQGNCKYSRMIPPGTYILSLALDQSLASLDITEVWLPGAREQSL